MTDRRGEEDFERQAPPEVLADESCAPVVLTPESLRTALERWRGKPLTLVTAPMPTGRPAMWIGTACCDYILYEPSLPLSQQVWAIACQAGHMLAGHRGSAAAGSAAANLFPDLDHAAVAAELPALAAFTAAEVREAEALAAMLITGTPPTPGSARQQQPGEP